MHLTVSRKGWIEHRLEELAEIFSVAVAGFAILDNHLHLLVRLDPDVARGWSDEDVVRRWGRLFPPRDKESKGANHVSRVPERGRPLPLRLGAGRGSSVESGSRPRPEVESPGRGAGPGSAGVPQHAGSRPLSGGALCRGGDDPRQEPQGWTRAVRWV